MNKQLIVAAIAGALVLPASIVAQADSDFTVYGRVVAGLDRQDSDKEGESAVWDFGATGRGGSGHQQSRIGFKGDRDLGNGMNAGFKMEQGINSGGDAGFNTRHRYVYLSGGFGTLTIGQQSNPYLMGANWAQEWYLGGNTVGSFREEGIGYAMSRGPFSLNVLLTGDNGDSSATATTINTGLIAAETDAEFLARVLAAARANGIAVIPERTMSHTDETYANAIRDAYNGVADDADDLDDQRVIETSAQQRERLIGATGLSRNAGEADTAFDMRLQSRAAALNAAGSAAERVADEDIDRTIIGASYDFGIAKLGFGYNADNTDSDYDWLAVGVSGAVGDFGYHVGWQQKDDTRPKVAGTDIGESDQDGWGMFLSYNMSEADKVYMEYETIEDDFGAKDDRDYTVLGYSHKFGGGVNFIGEYRTTSDSATNAAEPTRLALTMMVNF